MTTTELTGGWRSIQDAPRDGTVLLLWCGLVGCHQLGIWYDGVVEGRWETLDGVALEDAFRPSYWMYPPKGPTC